LVDHAGVCLSTYLWHEGGSMSSFLYLTPIDVSEERMVSDLLSIINIVRPFS
jgi:hypothetical protein